MAMVNKWSIGKPRSTVFRFVSVLISSPGAVFAPMPIPNVRLDCREARCLAQAAKNETEIAGQEIAHDGVASTSCASGNGCLRAFG